MNIKNSISKAKNRISKKAAAITAAINMLIISAMLQANAAVNFSGGVERVANDVTRQGKAIAATVFGAVAVVALAFTVAKGIKAGAAYHRGEQVNLGPVIGCGIGTIVAGLASATTFFGWFGL